jgi:hypothetical protein
VPSTLTRTTEGITAVDFPVMNKSLVVCKDATRRMETSSEKTLPSPASFTLRTSACDFIRSAGSPVLTNDRKQTTIPVTMNWGVVQRGNAFQFREGFLGFADKFEIHAGHFEVGKYLVREHNTVCSGEPALH